MDGEMQARREDEGDPQEVAVVAAQGPLPPTRDEKLGRVLADVLLGLVLEGTDLLPRALARGASATGTDMGTDEEVVMPHAPAVLQATLGAGREIGGGLRGGVTALWRFSSGVLHAGEPAPRRRPPVLVEMVQTMGEIVADQGRLTLDRWLANGRREEVRARIAARLVTTGMLDLVLEQLAHHPEVRAMVAQQGSEMAAGATGELRRRAGEADAWIERATRRLLKLPARS